MRRLIPFLLMTLLLPLGCATRQYDRNTLSAGAQVAINKNVEQAQGRREALQLADVQARDKLMFEVLRMKLADGRSLEEAAVKDPYVQAIVQDAVRAGHVDSDREITDDHVKLTVRMELGVIQDLIQRYPKMNR